MQLCGSITALATPFSANGQLDLAALRTSIDRQLLGGTNGLVIAGSTGEAAMLDEDEFETLLRAAVDQVKGRVPVLAGCGHSGTARTVAAVQRAKSCGIDAALVVTPPYVRPTQDGLIAHFTCVAEQGGLPVVLYNVPARTAGDLLPESVSRLLDIKGVIAIKEAVAEPQRMTALLALRSERFAVLSGDDPTALRALSAGADGVVSVASNVVPRAFSQLCALAFSDPARASAINSALIGLYEFLGCAPNPISLKAILAQLSVCADAVRLPLLPLPPELRGSLPKLADAVSALEHDLTQ